MAPKKQSNPGVTARQVWTALRNSGASAVAAAGIMGNWISESGLNPESHVMDSNGYESYGLANWNAKSYPTASSLVTGDPVKDLNAQVRFLGTTGGIDAAKGSTAQQAAASYAQNYERCQTCGGGQSQNTARQAQAATVASWAASNQWPSTVSAAADSATLQAASQAQSSATCLWQLPSIDLGIGSVGGECVLSKSQGRAIAATGILTGGAVVLGFGFVLMLVGTALASRGVRQVAQSVPGVAGLAVAAASAEDRAGDSADLQREQNAQDRHTAAQYRRQPRARQNYQRDNDPAPF